MEYLTAIIVAVVSSAAFSSIVTVIINNFGKHNPTKTALRLLIQDKLEHMITEAIAEGSVTIYKAKYIRALYQSYKALGGDGDMEHLMTEFEKIKIDYDS